MIRVNPMTQQEWTALYGIAMRAFQADYEQYGQFPPLLDLAHRRLRPGWERGYSAYENDTLVGGAFVYEKSDGMVLGAIFLDPPHQGKGYGADLIHYLESIYPHAERWTLDTPYQAYRNHRFYERLGYQKVGEVQPDPRYPFRLFLYQKQMIRE